MFDLPTTPIEVLSGSVEINDNRAYIYKRGDDILLLIIDCETKNAQVEYIGADGDIPEVGVAYPREDVDPYEDEDHDATTVLFVDLKGWNVHMAEVSRYTLSVCLIRNRV